MRNIKKNKRGVSDVVTTVLLIALTLVLVGVVWVVINNLVKSKLDDTGSCFETFDKLKINQRYTCYNSSSKEFQFSIDVGDIDLKEIVIKVSGEGTSASINLNSTLSQVQNLKSYPNRGANTVLPSKNSGLTYLFNMTAAGFSGEPDSMSIAPIIEGNQCDFADNIEEIDDCQSLIQ